MSAQMASEPTYPDGSEPRRSLNLWPWVFGALLLFLAIGLAVPRVHWQ